MAPISLAPDIQEQPPISLQDDQKTVSPGIADTRAKKAAFGLKDVTGKTYEDAYQAISVSYTHLTLPTKRIV